MHFNMRVIGIFSLAVVAMLSGCASTIQPEKQKEYGLLIPAEGSGSRIAEIDGDGKWGLPGGTFDVLPGQHTVRVTTCRHNADTCQDRNYTFEVKAGLAYAFEGPVITVYDRFHYDLNKPGLYTIGR